MACTPIAFAGLTGDMDTTMGGPPNQAYNTIDTSGNLGLLNILAAYAHKFKLVVAALSILFIVIAGIRMVTASGNEEIVKKNRTSVIWILVGLIIMNLAEPLVYYTYEQIDPVSFDKYKKLENLSTGLINPIITYILTFLAVAAVLMIVLAAFKMMTAQGDEGKVKKQTQTIIGALMGLFIIALARPVVEAFYGINTAVVNSNGSREGAKIIVQLANYIMGFTALAAIIMLIVSGFMMIVNFGNDQRVQKAKKMISWVLIGLALIMSAYMIVILFISPS
jgi:hypothetical protein